MENIIYKTKQHDKDTMITLRASWIDQSFEHAFGVQRQGFYEVTDVFIKNVKIPIDILDDKFLEEMDQYANK